MTSQRTQRRVPAAVAAKTALLLAATCPTVGSLATAASAGSMQTQTLHAHGSDAAGLMTIDLNPNSQNHPPVTPPSDCWLLPSYGLVSTTGEAVRHMTETAGFHLTDTYTGEAAVYPLVLDNGVPVTNSQHGDVVDPTQPAVATGHLTVWLGEETNQKTSVFHSTLTFHGTDPAGNPRDLRGHFQFTINADGQPTVREASLTC